MSREKQLEFLKICLFFIYLKSVSVLLQVSMCTMCMVDAKEARRGDWVPWTWMYRRLRAAMWVLGTKGGSAVKAVKALNQRVLS